MRVYITDGDYEVMKTLESVLTVRMKCEVRCFTTARRLTEAAEDTPPDTVLMDADAMSGYSAVGALQSVCPTAKIVIMSEKPERAIEVFRQSLYGFLLKPVTEETLREQMFKMKHPLLSKVLCKNKEGDIPQ